MPTVRRWDFKSARQSLNIVGLSWWNADNTQRSQFSFIVMTAESKHVRGWDARNKEMTSDSNQGGSWTELIRNCAFIYFLWVKLHPSSKSTKDTSTFDLLLSRRKRWVNDRKQVKWISRDECLYLALAASDLYTHLDYLNNVPASNYLPGCCFARWQTLFILINICFYGTWCRVAEWKWKCQTEYLRLCSLWITDCK